MYTDGRKVIERCILKCKGILYAHGTVCGTICEEIDFRQRDSCRIGVVMNRCKSSIKVAADGIDKEITRTVYAVRPMPMHFLFVRSIVYNLLCF